MASPPGSLAMPNRSSKKKKATKKVGGQIAASILEAATEEPAVESTKNPVAVALGRLGGKKGGQLGRRNSTRSDDARLLGRVHRARMQVGSHRPGRSASGDIGLLGRVWPPRMWGMGLPLDGYRPGQTRPARRPGALGSTCAS